jgi:hypothetical protein
MARAPAGKAGADARLGVAVFFAFSVFYRLPIPGESPGDPAETSG